MTGLDLDDIRDHVASLFIMLNRKTAILFRIEFLVVLATLLFLAMFFMDFFRRTIRNPFMRGVFSVFDAVSDSIVVYLLGAILTAPFRNQLFPVWALMLVNFRYSADYISGYGVPDPHGRRFTEWRNVVKLLGSAFLNRTHGSYFTGPLWLVWILQVTKSAYRYISHGMASRAFWHGRSSELVAEHMLAMHSSSMNKGGELLDPAATMKGYKYLVYGETKQQRQGGFNRLKKPQYALCIDQQQDQEATANNNVRRRRNDKEEEEKTKKKKKKSPVPVLTLDKIWDCPIPIHKQPQPHSLQRGQGRGEDDDGSGTKVLPLAFALSRLLRCRLEDVTLQPCIFDMNRELVKNIVGGKVAASDSDALRIMELQLAFVHDYFNTRYPMVFWCGLPSLFFSLLLSVLTICAFCWLAVDIRRVYNYKPSNGELTNLVKGFNVGMIITWAFIFLIVVKEIWEMLTYLLSDWTRLVMLCEYVQRRCKIRSNKESILDAWSDSILLYFSTRSRITDQRRWHGCIDQYVFVQSYNDTPCIRNLIHNITTGIVPRKDNGTELSSPIQIPECVKQAVLEKLVSMIVEDADEQPAAGHGHCTSTGSRRSLPRVIRTLSNSNLIRQQLQNYQAYYSTKRTTTNRSAHVSLPTSSHIILVWHIATSLCEMELATKHGVNLSSPAGFPWCLLSWFTSSCCCSSKRYLMDVRDREDKDTIMTWLAGLCSSNSKPIQKTTTQGRNKEVDGKLPDETQGRNKEVDGKLPDELQETYVIANSLSRYCAYLLIAKPDLIPDSFLVPKIVFQETVTSARDGILKDCGSLQKRYRALKDEAEKPIQDSEKEDVLKQGVALGKELLDHLTDKSCWEILAGVWTELLIHIAPTQNARAHRKCLAGGEFITHIWALLWHCGIHSSSLWPKDGVGPAGTNDPDPASGNDSDQAGNKIRQTGGHMRSSPIGINISEGEAYDDNKGTKEQHEARQLKERRNVENGENDGSSGIEGISQDVTMDTTNVQRGPKQD